MPITPKQARQELRRRQAVAELQRRGIDINISQQSIVGDAGRLPVQDRPPEQQKRIGQLIEQLGGRLPGIDPVPVAAFPGPEEEQRRRAYKELQSLGLSSEQIRLSTKTQKILGGARIGRTVGGIAGPIAATAIAGRFIPGPIDDAAILTYLIATGGAGLSGVIGEAIQTGIEEKRLIGKREALKAFAIEAGTELGGRGLVRGTKFIASPFIKKTVPEAASLVDDFAKVGGSFSPTELDKRFTLQIGEAFSRGGFGAKQIFQEFEEKQGRAVLAYADSIIDAIGEGVARQTPEEIGNLFAEGITRPNGRVLNILDDLVNPLYKQVDDLAKGSEVGFRQIKGITKVPSRGISGRYIQTKELQRLRLGPKVNTSSLKRFARKQLATDNRLNKQFLSPAGRNKLQKVLGLNEKISFSDMRLLRSSYLKDVRKLARDVDQSQGIVKQLASITDDAIFDPKATQGLNPEALRLLRNTNALYKAGKKGIEETFSANLAKRLLRNPSRIVKEIFPNNNPKAIRLLRQSLIEPISGRPSKEGKVLWNQLRQQWLADAVSDATKEGIAKPKVFDNIIRKMGDGFPEMFPEKDIANNVKKIQTLFDIAGKVPPTGVSLFSRGAQVYGVTKMYQGGKEGDFVGFTIGATLALGPLAFAKLATHPKGVKFLTAGFKIKPGASGLVPNTVRIIRLLRDINRKENKEQASILKQKMRQKRIARGPTLQQLRGFGGRGY